MRDIKFRIWNDVSKQMYYMDSPFWHDEYDMLAFEGDTPSPGTSELMQYTGVTDSNGQEIWEGDVVTIPGRYPYFDLEMTSEPNYVGVIRWIDAGFCFVLVCVNKAKHGISNGVSDLLESDNHFVVIGNIYENAELLS